MCCGFIFVCVLDAGEMSADCRGQQLSTDDLLKRLKEGLMMQVGYTHKLHKVINN